MIQLELRHHMLRALLPPCALVRPWQRRALACAHRSAPLALHAGAMDAELAAVRREHAARHAAAAAEAAAAAAQAPPAGAGAAPGGAAEAASLAAAAHRRQSEGSARAASRVGAAAASAATDNDDEVQIIEPPARRQRTGLAPQAPAVVADGVGFALTRCDSVLPEHNVGAVSLCDIFPTDGARPRFAIISNYMYEFPWLLQACPALLTAPTVFMLTHPANPSGGGDWARANLSRNFRVFTPQVPSFGTHHSKFLIIAYDKHLRVCIHTANYLSVDWADKTEGVWMQDFPLKGAGSPTSSAFENDLVDYLKATNWPALHEGHASCAVSLRGYDFSAARVALVASVPGSHEGVRYGHRRVRALLEGETFDPSGVGAPLVWQFSSNGTVRSNLIAEFRQSFSAGRTTTGAPLGLGEVKLVWPAVEEVRRSYEGWAGGNSIPAKRENVRRPEIRALHHRWAAATGRNSCPEGRARALPHIKMFLRHRGPNILWLLLGSHNLSGPAWGTETQAGRLRINSYELGVMFLPSLLPSGATRMACTAAARPGVADGTLGLRVPFALPPAPYGPADEPWDTETSQAAPDSRGFTLQRGAAAQYD